MSHTCPIMLLPLLRYMYMLLRDNITLVTTLVTMYYLLACWNAVLVTPGSVYNMSTTCLHVVYNNQHFVHIVYTCLHDASL